MSKIKGKYIESSVALAGNPTSTTQTQSDNSTKLATTAYVDTAISNIGDVVTLKGALDASAIGSQLDNTQAGDYYRVTVAGTLFGTNPITLAVGDALITKVDQVGTPDDGADFFKIDNTELDDQTALEVPVTAAYDSSAASGNVSAGVDSTQAALEKIEKKADDNASSISSKADTSVVAEIDANVDDLTTAVGIAENATDMGTFTGSTISDNGTAKAGMQELETAVEAAQSDATQGIADASTAQGDIDSHVDGGVNKHDASEIDVESAGTNHTATDLGSVISELDSAITSAAASGNTPQKDNFTLDGTDITNQYIDLSNVAKAESIAVLPVGGPEQDEGVDYTVSLTGGAGGNTRISFAGDLAAEAVATDKIVVKYQS